MQASHVRNPTLHPTPYTLHPTPYTLQPTPYTLHPATYTLHLTPSISATTTLTPRRVQASYVPNHAPPLSRQVSCRAKPAQSNDSRPDSGLDVAHSSGECPQHVLGGSLLARERRRSAEGLVTCRRVQESHAMNPKPQTPNPQPKFPKP